MSILYQWNNDVDQTLPAVELVRDISPGESMLLCPCGKEFYYKIHGNVERCPYCKGDIVFPRCDW